MRAGRYQIDDQSIAHGSQGVVHFGHHEDGYPVAIKIATDHPHAAPALRWEMQVLEALERAGVNGVVRCTDRITVGGRPAMVMPRYPTHLGEWLAQVVQRPAPNTLSEILRVSSQLARVLSRVHTIEIDGKTLIHRDVKPENVFMDAQGKIYLGDFGAALGIDGLRELELALYGTPMWAPLDQVLPGRTIPDPTWDTYAVCVILYAAITGARPAYQADPRELLTAQGRVLWELGQRAIAAQGDHACTLRIAFADERARAHTPDLVALTGTEALNRADRAALESGVRRLAQIAGSEQAAPLTRGLWNALTRGLSPVSHPSPPNRYRNGADLADALDDLAALMANERPSPRPTPPPAPPPPPAHPAPPTDIGEINPSGRAAEPEDDELYSDQPVRWSRWWMGGLLIATAAIALTAWSLRAAPSPTALFPASSVETPSGNTPVASFSLDRTEVSRGEWALCSAAKACPERDPAPPDLPVTGVSAAEAAAYCTWRGARLPTEAEWLRAAGSGPWPWARDEVTCDQAAASGCDGGLVPVTSMPKGASPEGVYHLAGNAWEWVIAPEGPVLRGGAIDSTRDELGKRGRWIPPSRSPSLAGLRCAE